MNMTKYTPKPTPWFVRCHVCGGLCNNVTEVCQRCEHLVVGTKERGSKVRFREIAKPENEWEVNIP